MNRVRIIAVVAGAAVSAACAHGADGALTPGGGLRRDGDEFVVSSSRFDGTLRTAGACPAAWHVFEGEYRTTGFRPEGYFNIDVTAADGKGRFSGENQLHASSSWSPGWWTACGRTSPCSASDRRTVSRSTAASGTCSRRPWPDV